MRLIFMLLPVALPVAAQPAPPAPPATAAAPDTVAALHRLFARKRHHRDVIAVAGFASGIACLGGASQTQPLRDAVALGNVGLLGVLVGGASLLYYQRYTPACEEQALAAWRAHQLPARLQRQLKASYFKEK